MLKNRVTCYSLLFFFFPFFVHGQVSLQGKVLDSEQKAVAFANVILLDAGDSTSVYQGVVTQENGNFVFENITEKTYLLKVSYVGFKDHLMAVEIEGDTELPAIVLREGGELAEVAINYIRPTIEREVDRLVFKVENSSLSSGSSWEILEKTPGVIGADNTLMVRNQGVQVYINDRKVRLSSSDLQTLLKNYPGENIESIEVITNPPAKYDAEGGAILNIITSKSISPGYKGNINGSYTQAIYPKYVLGTSHFFTGENLEFFANYTFSPRKEFKEDLSYINFIRDGKNFSRWETDFDRTTRSAAHNANLMLDYDFDNNDVLSLSVIGMISPDETYENDVFTDVGATPGVSDFTTDSELEEDVNNLAADLQYKHLFEEPGEHFSLRTHFTRYTRGRVQEVITRSHGSGAATSEFQTDADQEINIFTAQADLARNLDNFILETGAKVSTVRSLSGISFFDVIQGSRTYNPELSDQFSYDEDIFAAYLGLSRDWGSWSAKIGLRGEHSERRDFTVSIQEEDQAEEFEIFPSLYLQHVFSPRHSMSFDYSRKIERPKYENLNPFRYFLNRYNYNTVNPNLRSAISDNFNLNYTFNNEYFFDLYYRDNGPAIQTLGFQDNENFTLRNVSVNLLESISYGLDFVHYRNFTNWWSVYTYMSLFHEEQQFVALESGNQKASNEVDGFLGQLANTFILSKDGTFTGDLTLVYVSDYISGSYNLDPMTTLSAGLRKTFWNNRAEVSLRLEDMLNSTSTWMRSDYLNQDNGFFAQPENRYIRIGFKYNFGNFRLEDNRRDIEAAERERI